MRTISGRIVLGFLVLLATFGGVSLYTQRKMGELGRELRFIRTAYLDVSLRVAELRAYQSGIVQYLEWPALHRPHVMVNRETRRKFLEGCAHLLASLRVPAAHEAAIQRMRRRVAAQLAEYYANAALYDLALNPTAPPEAVKDALGKLKVSERAMLKDVVSWFDELKMSVEHTTTQLEEAERQARLGTTVLGALAAFVGLLVTVWAVLTLRPIARLRDGARRVASGDYGGRVEVAGATEIAELAREYNAMAAAIQEREQELVRSERLAAVGKMAAVITHEIRNPLSSIGLNAELLEDELGKRGGAAPEAAGLLRAIQKEVDRLTAITEEYLRFARLPRPRLEREQVNDIVGGLVEFQREELGLAGIQVVTDLAEGLPAVAADEAQLRQALLNLVRNAADAMTARGGVLTIGTCRAEGGVEVRVADTGPGIAEEHLPRIFEPFFSTKEGGTGLGLALAHEIVAEHGGRVDVASTPGRGTIFTVRLPAA